MNSTSPEVAVLGAGITGLSLCALLQHKGIAVDLLEASERVGGVLGSRRVDSFLLEQSAHTLLLDTPVRTLLEQLELPLTPVHAASDAKTRWLLADNSRLLPVPRSVMQVIRTPLLSPAAKLRALAEPFFARRPEHDCSVDEFAQSHFGQELAQEAFAAALTGVWAGDTKKLSAKYCLPNLWQRAQQDRSLLFSFLFNRKTRQKRGAVISFAGGIQDLLDALQRTLTPDSLKFGTKVREVRPKDSGVEIISSQGSTNYRQVYLCLPAQVSAGLLQPFQADLAQRIGSIEHRSLTISHLSFPRGGCPSPLKGYGFLCAPKRRKAIMGALYTSSLFPKAAHEEHHQVSVFSAAASEQEILEEITGLLGLAAPPRLLASEQWKEAIPNYHVGHEAVRNAVSKYHCGQQAVRLLGSWLDGISISARVQAAQEASRNYSEGRQKP